MKWQLEVFDWSNFNRTRMINRIETKDFDKLEDIWQYIGFELKERTNGYSGFNADETMEYVVRKIK